MTATITGIVHTKNEERNLRRALRSLAPVCDEMLVVDMQSTDRTLEIAESMGARVLSVPDYGYVEPAILQAWQHVTTDWILRIDADEVVPRRLGAELKRIAGDDAADLVSNGRLNFLIGERVHDLGWGKKRDRHYFFFKRGHLDLGEPDRIHNLPRASAGSRVELMPLDDDLCVWHFSYTDWSNFVTKMDRYTTVEAELLRPVGGLRGVFALLMAIARELAVRGVRGQAQRDGYRGFVLLWLMLTYRILAWAKARQFAEIGDREAIERAYDELARQAVEEVT